MADVYLALMQKVFHTPQREREPDVHHNRQLDDLTRRFEVTK